MGGSYRDRPIFIVVLHVFRDPQHEAGGWVGGAKWEFQRDVIFEQPLIR